MKKRKTHAFNKDIFLLGKRKADKKNVYLEAPSWDCGWYWGFGYLETYTNNESPSLSRDIYTHSHFDGDILNGKSHGFDNFKEYFSETPLTDDEIWTLCDYMQTFYTLRKAAETFRYGGSHYTAQAASEAIKSETIENEINKKILPALFDKIIKLLTPEE